jgi:hypothetical protein
MIWLAGLLATALLAYSSLLRTSAKGGACGKSVGAALHFSYRQNLPENEADSPGTSTRYETERCCKRPL